MEIYGWNRTLLLALGAAAGVLVTAYLIHLSKAGTTAWRGAAYR
ncbi:MAG: hypothetical protein ACTSVW_00380 [Candidatus Njordarchaeales archaeon]